MTSSHNLQPVSTGTHSKEAVMDEFRVRNPIGEIASHIIFSAIMVFFAGWGILSGRAVILTSLTAILTIVTLIQRMLWVIEVSGPKLRVRRAFSPLSFNFSDMAYAVEARSLGIPTLRLYTRDLSTTLLKEIYRSSPNYDLLEQRLRDEGVKFMSRREHRQLTINN
jgi:hypothetical protein